MNVADSSRDLTPSGGQQTPEQELVDKLTPLIRPEKKQDVARVVGTVLRKVHSGPLPAPEDLGQYEAICPGAAGRIIAMAEQNMAHRQSMETTLVSKEYGLRTRGQWLAFAALLAILVVVAFTFWLGQPIAAGLLGGATIVAIVGMFLGRDRAREEAKQTQVPEKPGRAKSRRK